MFCPQCGANNADNAISCVQCGRSFQPAAVMQPGVQPAVQVPNYLVFAIVVTVPAGGDPSHCLRGSGQREVAGR